MKVKRKLDPLTLLALIVVIGVLLSMWTHMANNVSPAKEITPAHSLEQKAATLYRGNFIRVSAQSRMTSD